MPITILPYLSGKGRGFAIKYHWVIVDTGPNVEILVLGVSQAGDTEDGAIERGGEVARRPGAQLAVLCVVKNYGTTILGRKHGNRAVPCLIGEGLDWGREALEVNQILGNDVIPVVLAALVPNVIDAFIVGNATAIIDWFQFDWLSGSRLSDVPNYLRIV